MRRARAAMFWLRGERRKSEMCFVRSVAPMLFILAFLRLVVWLLLKLRKLYLLSLVLQDFPLLQRISRLATKSARFHTTSSAHPALSPRQLVAERGFNRRDWRRRLGSGPATSTGTWEGQSASQKIRILPGTSFPGNRFASQGVIGALVENVWTKFAAPDRRNARSLSVGNIFPKADGDFEKEVGGRISS